MSDPAAFWLSVSPWYSWKILPNCAKSNENFFDEPVIVFGERFAGAVPSSTGKTPKTETQ
jgi:hypothetical protein